MADAGSEIPSKLEAVLGFHIRLAHGAVYRQFNETFGTLGLTQKQTSVLWLVGDQPGLSQIDIARRLQIDRATMMVITNSLAKRGLMERHASSADRRRQTLHLTPSGAATLSRAQVAIAEHEAWLRSRFTSQDVLQLIELLQRVYSEPSRKLGL